MSDIDLQVALMESGRMNLMHLPPGAISWLWDRPTKQINAAESLAVAANAHGNPVVDASLLKADQNILLIKCEGGECFRIYPDGGFSHEDTPMDIGGCTSVLQGMPQDECPMDDNGHQMGIEEDDGEDDGDYAYDSWKDKQLDIKTGNTFKPQVPDLRREKEEDMARDMEAEMRTARGEYDEDIGNDEHMDTEPPESGVASPIGMTNLAGEPTMDEDQGGDVGGPGASAMGGMGTGTPYVGDMAMDADPELENMMMSRELGEASIHMFRNADDDLLNELSDALGLNEYFHPDMDDAPTAAELAADEHGEVSNIKLEVYDDSSDSYQDVPLTLEWHVEPTEYDGQYVSSQGEAYVEKMELGKPIKVNGKVHREMNEELAALILNTMSANVEQGSTAEASLANYISDQKSGSINIPQHRYADSTR